MKAKILSRMIPVILIVAIIAGLIIFYGVTLDRDDNLSITKTNLVSLASVSGNTGSKFAFDDSKMTVWSVNKKGSEAVISFDDYQNVNALLLNENGYNVKQFSVYYDDGDGWKLCYRQNEIGVNRLATFYTVKAKAVKIVIDDFKNIARISDIKVYCLNQRERTEKFRITSYVTVGSVADYDQSTGKGANIDAAAFDVITDVQFNAYGRFSVNGDVIPDDNASKALDNLKHMIGDREVNISITIFPPSDGSMADLLRNNMDKAVDAVVNTVLDADVKGVDFDWEYPNGKEEYSLFSEFIVKLSEKLHSHDKTIALALSPWGLDFSKEAVAAIDQVHIMAYDLFDHNGDNNSYAGACATSIDYMLKQGFSLEQLNLGISFYGRPSDASGVWIDYNNPDYEKDEYIMVVNDIYFNTVTTVRDKAVYCILRGLGGIMVFSQNEDLPMSDPLSLTAELGRARDTFSKEV